MGIKLYRERFVVGASWSNEDANLQSFHRPGVGFHYTIIFTGAVALLSETSNDGASP